MSDTIKGTKEASELTPLTTGDYLNALVAFKGKDFEKAGYEDALLDNVIGTTAFISQTKDGTPVRYRLPLHRVEGF